MLNTCWTLPLVCEVAVNAKQRVCWPESAL